MGEIVNLMSVDAQRLMDVVTYLHIIWSGPLQILLSLLLLYQTMGPSIFAGFGVMVLLIPITSVISMVSKKLQVKARSQLHTIHNIIVLIISLTLGKANGQERY